MKSLLLATSLASLALAAPAFAEFGPDARAVLTILPAGGPLVLERHGHRADDPAGDDHMERRGRGGRSSGHGGRPRVPGGSGCDDPRDLIEHPECRA